MKTKGTSFGVRISIYILFCSLVVFWGFQVSGEKWTDAQKEVWKSVETRWEYLIKGNLEGIMGCYHDDAVYWHLSNRRYWSRSGVTSDKDSIEAIFNGWLSGYYRPVSYELEPLAIHIFGDVANVFYRCKFKLGAGPPRTYYRNEMVSYIKQNNKWLAIGAMMFGHTGIQD